MQGFPTDFLHQLCPGGLPPHILNLKENARIMLLRNLNLNQAFCNGTLMRVAKMYDNVILCRNLINNKHIFIHRMVTTSKETGFPFTLKRTQFTIRLAYAITISKSQGSTFDKVGGYLDQSVFSHGQLYTMFSRVRSMNNIKVLVLNTHDQGNLGPNPDDVFVNNIVFREVLLGDQPEQPVEFLGLYKNDQNKNQYEVNNAQQNNLDINFDDIENEDNQKLNNFFDNIDQTFTYTVNKNKEQIIKHIDNNDNDNDLSQKLIENYNKNELTPPPSPQFESNEYASTNTITTKTYISDDTHKSNEKTLNENACLNNTDIYRFLNKLHKLYGTTIKGFDNPKFIIDKTIPLSKTLKPKDKFIQICEIENNHWICVAKGFKFDNSTKDNSIDMCLYDSKKRKTIDYILGNQLIKFVNENELKKRNIIKIQIQDTDEYSIDFSGYVALATAFALCRNKNPEHCKFNQNDLRSHYIQVMLKDTEFSMFPFEQRKSGIDSKTIMTYDKNTQMPKIITHMIPFKPVHSEIIPIRVQNQRENTTLKMPNINQLVSTFPLINNPLDSHQIKHIKSIVEQLPIYKQPVKVLPPQIPDNYIATTYVKQIKNIQEDSSQPILQLLPQSNPVDATDGRNTRQNLINGCWLNGTDISLFLAKLRLYLPKVDLNGKILPNNKMKGIQCKGLEPIRRLTILSWITKDYLDKYSNTDPIMKDTTFIRICNSDNNHWVCVAGGLEWAPTRKNFIDVCLFDSLPRNLIDADLGEQMKEFLREDCINKSKKHILIQIRNISQQIKSYTCGYIALANAFALCIGLNPENIEFDEENLKNHYINIMHSNSEFKMFPYRNKQANLGRKILMYLPENIQQRFIKSKERRKFKP